MFCKYCGALLDDDAVFCEKCGKRVPDRSADQIQKDVDLKPAEMTEGGTKTTVEQTERHTETVPAGSTNPVKGAFSLARILLLLGAVVLVVAAGVFITGKNRGIKTQEAGVPDVLSQNNFYNGGIFAYDSEKLYFCAPYEEDSDEYSLYSTDLEGNNKQLISSNDKIRRFRIAENKLLYTAEYEDDKYTLEMMNPDGTDVKTIVRDKPGLSLFDKSGEDVFYVSNKELHTCSETGENDRVILRDVNNFVCIKDILYYTTDKAAFSYNRQSEEETRLIDGSIQELCYEDGTLYYRKDNAVYRMDLNGNEEKKLADVENARSMLVLDKQIAMLHPMSYDEMVKVFGEDAKATILAAVGGGYLMTLPKEGGAVSSVKEVYVGVELFGCKDDMYVIMSYLSKELVSLKSLITD